MDSQRRVYSDKRLYPDTLTVDTLKRVRREFDRMERRALEDLRKELDNLLRKY